MNNWKKCKLGDIGKVITGKTPSAKNPEDWGNDMCFITPTDYKDYRKIASSSIRKLSNIGIERLKNKILPPKSIMVTCIGSDMGKVAVNKNPSITNQQINSIIPYEKVADADFVYYLLVSMYDTLRTYGLDGTAVPILNKSDFETIEILLPSLEEQRQIAAILSSIDDKIELLHEQNKTLEELAQTLFRHYFIENPNPSWQEKPLSDFGNIICGKTPSKKVDEYYNGDIPFIKIPDMHGNIFVFKTNECLSELGSQTQINKFIPKKSICISCIATVGVVSMNAFESHTNQQINSIIPKKEHYRYFLYLYMKHLYDYLQSMASGGTATANLNTRDFSNIHILMPDEEMMINFNGKTSEYFDKIFKNLEQIQTLENMRDILIPKLLNGEIKINN